MKKIVIATNRLWDQSMPDSIRQKTKMDVVLLSGRTDLTFERLSCIDPEYVFFPHWSYLVPKKVYENFACVMFHMTDLPFGRGGSPLQNLISRGVYKTKITAFKCNAGLDAGPVYLKEPISLDGSAQEVFIRASKVIEKMIGHIIEKKIKPKPQKGKAVYFKRREPFKSEISEGMSAAKLYDHIRMLDAEGYPKAFIRISGFKMEFSQAQLRSGYINANVRIFKN